MNKLLANLNILYIKLHNYHYNVIGEDFYKTHKFLEKEYNIIHEWIDDVAEEIKKNGEYPLGRMKDYLDVATLNEVDSEDYYHDLIFKDLLNDYITLEHDIKTILDENISVSQDDLLTSMSSELSTKIWFFKSMLK